MTVVLGIETSCDETGVGIVSLDDTGRVELLADEIASSVEEHARFGGVVPVVASRAHLQAMVPAVHRALKTAGVRPRDVAAVAVTAGPGLAGALLVGVAAAKAYAAAWDVPLYGVNHLAAHVAVDTLQHGPLPPCLALLVSGGHSSLLDVPDLAGPVTPLGATIDDAAGEAFDKVARLLGLPFPGGPHIDRVGRDGDPGGGQRPVHRRDHRLQVRPGGHLGHHPAEPGVLLDAGGDLVGQQLPATHDAHPRLVAGGLDANDQRAEDQRAAHDAPESAAGWFGQDSRSYNFKISACRPGP